MSAPRALRLALERASDSVLKQPLVVAGTERLTADAASLPDLVAEGALVLLLAGPQAATGAIMLEPAIANGIVEAQTTGTIGVAEGPMRAMTRIDAALSVPLLDAALDRFASNLADGPDAHWSTGFASGEMLEAPRALRIALTEERYHVFRVALRLGEEGRAGGMVMALPIKDAPTSCDSAAQDDAPVDPRWQDRILGAHIRLDTVLCRIELPLSQVLTLSPGDVLPVAADALRDVRIEAGTRRPVARGRLGQLGGRRALRLMVKAARTVREPPQEEWVPGGFSTHIQEVNEDAPARDADQLSNHPEMPNISRGNPVSESPMSQALEAEECDPQDRLSDAAVEALANTV